MQKLVGAGDSEQHLLSSSLCLSTLSFGCSSTPWLLPVCLLIISWCEQTACQETPLCPQDPSASAADTVLPGGCVRLTSSRKPPP